MGTSSSGIDSKICVSFVSLRMTQIRYIARDELTSIKIQAFITILTVILAYVPFCTQPAFMAKKLGKKLSWLKVECLAYGAILSLILN